MMKAKDEALDVFKKFRMLVEKDSDQNIKTL